MKPSFGGVESQGRTMTQRQCPMEKTTTTRSLAWKEGATTTASSFLHSW